jgi:hypothetical protein
MSRRVGEPAFREAKPRVMITAAMYYMQAVRLAHQNREGGSMRRMKMKREIAFLALIAAMIGPAGAWADVTLLQGSAGLPARA